MHPTLINPTTTPRKRAKSITNKLKKATGTRNNPIVEDDDTPTKHGKYWEQSKEAEVTPRPPTVSHKHVLQTNVLLNDETLIVALNKLKIKHNINTVDPYLHTMLQGHEWVSNRRYFIPEVPNAWTHINRAVPINSHEALSIPIHCSHCNAQEMNHYVMAARFKNEDTQEDWDLVLVDSLNNRGTMNTAKDILRNRTTLLQKEGHMDTLTPNTTQESTRIWTATCVSQKELECGVRTILHIFLAGTSKIARGCPYSCAFQRCVWS